MSVKHIFKWGNKWQIWILAALFLKMGFVHITNVSFLACSSRVLGLYGGRGQFLTKNEYKRWEYRGRWLWWTSATAEQENWTFGHETLTRLWHGTPFSPGIAGVGWMIDKISPRSRCKRRSWGVWEAGITFMRPGLKHIWLLMLINLLHLH